jgi:hypothetical protein
MLRHGPYFLRARIWKHTVYWNLSACSNYANSFASRYLVTSVLTVLMTTTAHVRGANKSTLSSSDMTDTNVSWQGHLLYCSSSVLSGKISRLGHDGFLGKPLQLTTHHSSKQSTLYVLRCRQCPEVNHRRKGVSSFSAITELRSSRLRVVKLRVLGCEAV